MTGPGLIFLQLTVLLVTSQVIAYSIKRLGQPPVVGQMLSGVVLGPSVFGLLSPGLQHQLFPPSAMPALSAMGQLGLALYMFVVGAEVDRHFLRKNMKGAAAVSSAGVAVPLVAGALLTLPLIGNSTLFPTGVAGWTRVAFFATAIAVTAFPVMARIIDEQGLHGTAVANVALAAGSISDVVAWTLLAVVMAGVATQSGGVFVILGGGAVITIVMLSGVRLLLRRYLHGKLSASPLSARTLAFILALVMVSAWATTTTGLHPAFGAFLLGVAMPRNQLTTQIQARISPVAVNLLLPIFFIYAGLNTRIGLVNTPQLVLLALMIIAVACLSKGVACWLAATIAGYGQRDAVAIGILMNARGLVELIILTAALDNKIITPTLFSIMVVMTVVTTLMAAPVLRYLYRPVQVEDGHADPPSILPRTDVTAEGHG